MATSGLRWAIEKRRRGSPFDRREVLQVASTHDLFAEAPRRHLTREGGGALVGLVVVPQLADRIKPGPGLLHRRQLFRLLGQPRRQRDHAAGVADRLWQRA